MQNKIKTVPLLFFLVLGEPVCAELSGYVAVEERGFGQRALDNDQHNSALSISVEPEFYTDWDNGRQSFTLKPFARWDQHDNERTHFDIREAVWIMSGDDWELRAGADKVFWGVTEAWHLIDVINQTDMLENPDGEEKLGQPMVKFSLERDWGTLDAYAMPWFRERTYPGSHGRLRTHPRVDADQAEYESDLEDWYPSVALRWSHAIGDWDVGVSQFHGISRDPSFQPGIDSSGDPVLIPRYEIIDQTSLDLQATLGDWLWKLEALHRGGQGEESYFAATGGFEYTFIGIAETASDIGLLTELMWDERGAAASTPFNRDVFVGVRWTANDEQSTELLGGVIMDLSNQTRLINLEASRRLGDAWKLSVQARLWTNVAANDQAAALRQDDYVEVKLIHYF